MRLWHKNSLAICLEVWKTSVTLLPKTIRNNNKTHKAMKTKFRFSVNKKLNGVLNEIYADLLSISDTEEQSRNEVKRYVNEFRRVDDCNIAQYGNMLIYYYQVRDMYRKHGYKSMDRISDNQVWAIYLRQVGYVARLVAGDRL